MLHQFSYHRPDSLDEALGLLSAHGDRARVFAGGTDLFVNVRAGLLRPQHVVDLKAIEALQDLSWTESEGLSIGACVTVNRLIEHDAVRDRFSLLAIAATELATFQLRNRATVVGNLVTASPCGDMGGALLALGGQVVLLSADGERTLALAEFITGVKQTLIRPNEIVARVVVPNRWSGAAAGYRKLKRIKGHDLGVVSVSMVKHPQGLRVAISSAAPTPLLLPEMPLETDLATVQSHTHRMISPIDDVRASAEYRAFMVDVFIRRLFESIPTPGAAAQEVSA